MILPDIRFGHAEKASSSEAIAHRPTPTERASTPKVIIVEDELMVAWFLETLLLDMELEVAGSFSTGEATLAAADRLKPDLIMMDINLGDGIDGVETAVRLRQRTPVPIIFFSAYADEMVRARISREIPDARLLIKPASSLALQKAVESVLRTTH